MKRFGLLIFFLFTAVVSSGKAQGITTHTLVHAGYAYQNNSFGEVGARLLFLNTDDVLFRVGGAALLGSVNGKFAALPKLQTDVLLNFQRGYDLYHSWYFLGGAELTSKYVAPKIGFSLFGLIDLTGGYGFPLGDARLNGKEMKGFNLNFTVNIPIVLIHDLAN
ncbi:MAG: hypothetical protein EAS48_08195 [Chryseobacterium sp.]|nr:MAG: hypothetical protein EAS48_08195 [Chryseobacterium sp.]